ncbi:MAG: hypothetical protein JXB45_03150 [Candidatus Krumholzibacteriota bacterium]|nr:hypothetical protein [Candidatus Krumholzibacteriota bacterium]
MEKLKPDKSISGHLPAILTTAIFFILVFLWGLSAAYGFMAFVFLVFSILSILAYGRTKSYCYLVAALFQLFYGLWLASASYAGGIEYAKRGKLPLFFFWIGVFLMLWLFFLLLTRRFKWRGREIMELAALPVEELGDGFTERPRPAGKIEYSPRELLEFSEFLGRKLIAMPYRESDKIVFVPVTMARSMIHAYNPFHDYTRDSWVSFDNRGNVSVNIARRDYYSYQDELSFDQLCESLGNLFVDFLRMHRRGEEVRIMDRLDALRIGPFD